MEAVRFLVCSFHIALAFIHDKRITSAATLFVAHDSYPLDRAVAFELAAEVALGGGFMQARDKQRFIRVTNGFGVVGGFISLLSNFEIFCPLFLALFPPNLSLDLFDVRKDGLFTLFHGDVRFAGAQHGFCFRLLELSNEMCNAGDIF